MNDNSEWLLDLCKSPLNKIISIKFFILSRKLSTKLSEKELSAIMRKVNAWNFIYLLCTLMGAFCVFF